jgi:hypothetical protein
MPPKEKGSTKEKKNQDAADKPEDQALAQAALVSSTFANVELQATRQTLNQYIQLCSSLKDENQRLSADLTERDRDSMKVVQFLRRQLDETQAELASLKAQGEADVQKLNAQFGVDRAQLIAEVTGRDETIGKREEQIQTLQAELDSLNNFTVERQELRDEITRLQLAHQHDVERFEAQISKMRFQSLEEKVRVKAEERSMTEQFEAEVNDRAMKLLDQKTREIHMENFALLQDKILLEQELDRMTLQNKKLRDQTADQKREIELAKLADEEYAKRGARQAREIKDLKAQTKALEENLVKAIAEYEHKFQRQTTTLELELNKTRDERDMAYKNAEARNKELLKMRQLSKQIVRQRTELETFFNEALDHVRTEVLRERQMALLGQSQPMPTEGSSKGPILRIAASREASAAAAQQQPPARAHDAHPFFQGGGFVPLLQGSDDIPTQPQVSSAPGAYRGSLPAIKPSSTGSLPQLAPSQRDSTPQATSGGYVPPMTGVTQADISHLSWVDKERVLRILLAKINNASMIRPPARPEAAPTAPKVIVPVVPPPLLKQRNSEDVIGKSDTFVTQQV